MIFSSFNLWMFPNIGGKPPKNGWCIIYNGTPLSKMDALFFFPLFLVQHPYWSKMDIIQVTDWIRTTCKNSLRLVTRVIFERQPLCHNINSNASTNDGMKPIPHQGSKKKNGDIFKSNINICLSIRSHVPACHHHQPSS